MERKNRTLVETTRTMLIFSCALFFLWAEVIATTCFTQNSSIIYRRFRKTTYELINGKKPDISFLHVFKALCYPKNDREYIRRLGAKGDIGFFIGYYANFCAYRVYNRRTKKIMDMMNVTFNELSAMAFKEYSLKPEIQSMTSGQISSGLDLTCAPSIITSQKPTERELERLFEAMYDDYIGGQSSAAPRTNHAAPAPQVLQTPTTSTTTADTAATPQIHVHKLHPSNMHTFYQPYPHEYLWVKDHLLEEVIGEPSRPILTRIQLRTDGDMCNYTLIVSTMKPSNVKEAMIDSAWIDSMKEEHLQFKRLDV
nr:hypothetical protein [Tanacetum cinerariifolium]